MFNFKRISPAALGPNFKRAWEKLGARAREGLASSLEDVRQCHTNDPGTPATPLKLFQKAKQRRGEKAQQRGPVKLKSTPPSRNSLGRFSTKLTFLAQLAGLSPAGSQLAGGGGAGHELQGHELLQGVIFGCSCLLVVHVCSVLNTPTR